MSATADDGEGLPQVLRDRLEAFPVDEVRDQADRLAAGAVEVTRVEQALTALDVPVDERRELCNVYIRALYGRLDAAGKRWRAQPQTPAGRIVGVLHEKRGRARQTADRLSQAGRTWVSNRQVSRRRRRWEQLLA